MENKVGVLFLIGLLSILVHSASAKDITCIIKGKVINSESKEVLLYKGTDGFRTNIVAIPIVDNSFEDILSVPASEVYALALEDDIANFPTIMLAMPHLLLP